MHAMKQDHGLEPDQEIEAIYHSGCASGHAQIDRLFLWLFPLQWAFLVLVAWFYTPLTWSGSQAETHVHLWSAVVLGGAATMFPVFALRARAGSALSRSIAAGSQLFLSTLLIHICGGRIEAHFHIFASLAIVSAYRDWRALVTATVVAALDHVTRGIWMPVSIFGVEMVSYWRVLEHVLYVVFEDAMLFTAMYLSLRETRRMASVQFEANELARRLEVERSAVEGQVQQAIDEFIFERVETALRGIREMVVSIEGTARNASELAQHSGSNEGLARQGNATMKELMAQVTELARGVRETSEILVSLQSSSQKIGTVTKIIEGVAFQTNLLALNAAVEAARAGEHGKGFAVVAEEVRALANRTASAVTEIDQMARSILSDSGRAREAIESACERADQSLDNATTASANLASVESSSKEMAQLVSRVAAATEKQSASSSLLSSQVENITTYASA